MWDVEVEAGGGKDGVMKDMILKKFLTFKQQTVVK